MYLDFSQSWQKINLASDILAGELEGRSGVIQAAINLELSTDSISRFNVKMEGLNGQLPNLDLINTVARLCKRENIPVTLQKRVCIVYNEALFVSQTFIHMDMLFQASVVFLATQK